MKKQKHHQIFVRKGQFFNLATCFSSSTIVCFWSFTLCWCPSISRSLGSGLEGPVVAPYVACQPGWWDVFPPLLFRRGVTVTLVSLCQTNRQNKVTVRGKLFLTFIFKTYEIQASGHVPSCANWHQSAPRGHMSAQRHTFYNVIWWVSWSNRSGLGSVGLSLIPAAVLNGGQTLIIMNIGLYTKS